MESRATEWAGRVKQRLARKISRFATVGAANALVYALATQAYADVFAISAAVASGLGYLTAVPLAYLMHRHFTFDVKSEVAAQFIRFVGTQVLGFFLAVFLAWFFTGWLDCHIWVGVAATILTVPVLSYVVMDKWVFINR